MGDFAVGSRLLPHAALSGTHSQAAATTLKLCKVVQRGGTLIKTARSASLRRSSRIYIRIPVTLSGTLPNGKAFTEETNVLSVSKYGAKLATQMPLKVGMEVKVQPKRGRDSGLFRVAWTGRPGSPREGEAGIEYVRVSNLLGVSFPE
jgi:hypothetical protein